MVHDAVWHGVNMNSVRPNATVNNPLNPAIHNLIKRHDAMRAAERDNCSECIE